MSQKFCEDEIGLESMSAPLLVGAETAPPRPMSRGDTVEKPKKNRNKLKMEPKSRDKLKMKLKPQ